MPYGTLGQERVKAAMVGGKGNFMGRKKEDYEHYANSTTRQKKPFRIEKVTTVFLIGRFQFVNLITTFEQHSALIHYTECQRFFLNGFWCQACLYCANNDGMLQLSKNY